MIGSMAEGQDPQTSVEHVPEPPDRPLRYVSLLALKLGFTAFGGPAAHIAMLRDEVVARRGWMTDRYFLDLLGASNLIPGPSSTEMVMHVGMEQAGWRGLLAAGWLFILPAASITLAFAWAYGQFGSTPAAHWLLYGVKPVVVAIIVQAIWGLARTAMSSTITIAAGIVCLVLALLGLNELAILLGAGVILALVRWLPSRIGALALLPILPLTPAFWAAVPEPFSQATLFWRFLKIGATLFGSGYVLLAFLERDFVDQLGWITRQQLLDAVAVGQFTPGPLFTTATFIGYLTGGVPGAAIATVAIFLPAFLLVGLTHRYVTRIREFPLSAGFLDGVNAAAVALMAAVALALGRDALVDLPTIALAAAAAFLLIQYRVNSALLIALGALAGLLMRVWFGG